MPPTPASPLSPEAVRAQILEIARRELALGEDELGRITDGAELGEHLDSVQRLTLVVGIEDHFQICFEPEDDEAAVTLGDVARLVSQRMAAP